MKLLTYPPLDDFLSGVDLKYPEPVQPHHYEFLELERQCFCAGCGARIPYVGPFWRWPTLGIVTCANHTCFEAYKNNLFHSDIHAARERLLSRCENLPISKPGREAPTLREFMDLVLPVK